MLGDARGHCRGGPATGVGQTRLGGTDIIDRPDQIHAMWPRQGMACQGAPTAGQRGQPLPQRRVEPLHVRGLDHAVALRPTAQGLDASRRALAPPASLGALDHLGEQDVAPWAQPGPSALSWGTGSRKVSRMARRDDTKPSVQLNRGRCAAGAGRGRAAR
jgi:hypothetical protein